MKLLFEVILSVALVGAWVLVAATASQATKVDGSPAPVAVAVAASAATS